MADWLVSGMPPWLAAVVRVGLWGSLMMGCFGLWQGITLSLPGRTETHDSNGTPGPIVLAQSGGLVLIGAAGLLGGRWVYLIIPAIVLLTVSEVHAGIRWLRRRRQSSLPTGRQELSDT